MPDAPKPISKPKLLIGEGKEEVNIFEALLNHLNIVDIEVKLYEGKPKFLSFLKTLMITPGFNRVASFGITRDADKDADNAFKSICNFLKSVGLSSPNLPGEFVGNNPKVGVLILPGHGSTGMLEDMCLAAIAGDPKLQCVDTLFDCVLQVSGLLPTEMSKARIHAWLSTQIKPDKRLGEAAKAGYLPWDSPAFDPLKRFLQGM